MIRLVVRYDDDGTVGVVTRIGAVRSADCGEERCKRRGEIRASLPEAIQHQRIKLAVTADHVKDLRVAPSGHSHDLTMQLVDLTPQASQCCRSLPREHILASRLRGRRGGPWS